MKKRAASTARDPDLGTGFRDATAAASMETIHDADALALNDPAAYRRLLDGYFLLLGQRRLWWERCEEAEDSAWKAYVRATIIAIAAPSGWSPRQLAEILDLEDAFPRAKQRIFQLAREAFYRTAVTV